MGDLKHPVRLEASEEGSRSVAAPLSVQNLLHLRFLDRMTLLEKSVPHRWWLLVDSCHVLCRHLTQEPSFVGPCDHATHEQHKDQ